MHGDERVRFCGQCKLNVYNIAELARDEAERLITDTEGHLCTRLHVRADGTVITRDCPVGLSAIRRRLAKALTSIATLIGVVLSAAVAIDGRRDSLVRLTWMKPFNRLAAWIDPPVYVIAGTTVCDDLQPALEAYFEAQNVRNFVVTTKPVDDPVATPGAQSE
jgi:hypothetical protein